MEVYLINILLLSTEAYWLLVDKTKSNLKNPEGTFCFLATLQWILLSGLRGLSVGPDTYVYKHYSFDRTLLRSWDSLLNDFIGTIKGELSVKDPGYKLIEKAFQTFSDSYQIWLFFIAIVFTVALGVWIHKNSSNVFFSFLIFSCLFYSFFAITGHRQTIATAFVVFLGDDLIRKRKFIPFLLITLVMSTVHKSCLIFLLLYFLYNVKISNLYVLCVLVAFIISFLFRNSLLTILAGFSGYDSYDVVQNSGAGTFSLMLLAIISVALWRRKWILSHNPNALIAYNALLISILFLPLVFVNPTMMRVVQYFSVYIMLMIPYIIDSFPSTKDKRLVIGVILALLLFLYIQTNPQYYFFWNDPLK